MIMFTNETKAYDVIETAQILGLAVGTVRLYLSQGKLHGERVKEERSKVYITQDEIRRFIKERCNG
jgi:predicted transcriptional regulator